MKKINYTILSCFAGLILFSFQDAIAQEATFKKNLLEVTKQRTNDFDELTLRKMMKADGVSDPVIDKLIVQRKLLMQQGKNVNWTNVKNVSNPSAAQAPCNDIGVENGWGAWLGDVGTATTGSQTWTPPPATPTAPNFSITTGTGIDPNTPDSAGGPIIPYVCPGFGNSSIQLGEPCVAGCVAEQLTYPITVGVNDTNFVYAYAIVIQDAGHSVPQQPFVDICIYDAVGSPIPGGCFRYTGGATIPGFYPVSGVGCAPTFGSQYKPWTYVGIDLSAYIGQTLNVVISNVDCAACGHWAYSYWDFSCLPITTPTSITENSVSELNISVYPNPATEAITIEINFETQMKVEVSVCNILGEQIYSETMEAKQAKKIIPVAKLPGGIYFIQAKTNSGVFVKKFIRQ